MTIRSTAGTTRRTFAARGAALATLAFAGRALAQAPFPSKPIELVVPFPPGSGSDIGARYFAEQLGRLSGQPATVRNIAGGNGFIAISNVLRADPGGHTIFIGANSAFVVNAVQFRKLPYDPIGDFTMLGMLNRAPALLAVRGDSPARDLKSFVERARLAPGEVNSGHGATSYLMFASQFYNLAGIKVNHVPYKGASDLAAALASNVVDAGFIDPGSGLALAQAGRIHVLAVAGEKRLPQLPGVPTFQEAGYPDFTAYNWAAAAVSAKTPAPVVARLEAWFSAIARADATRSFFAATGNEAVQTTGAELRRFQLAEIQRWTDTARLVNLVQE